ncbi:MAG: hypothetical protein Q7S28_03815 [bacterium]|nr:hypothetical protein [bacterium]
MADKKPPMDALDKARWESWHHAIDQFLKERVVNRISNLAGQMEQIKKKHAIYVDQKHVALVNVAELEERIAHLTAQLENQSFDELFTQLLAMEGVRKVRVVGQTIALDTKRIIQEIGYGRYDIGQFTIGINVGNLRSSRLADISFESGPYRGVYTHAHAQDKETCFGSTSDTLNNTFIEKLLSDLDIAPLVQLLLSFLRHETTPPTTKEHIEPYDEARYGRGYDDPEEEAMARRAFVSLMRTALLPRKTAWLRKELARRKRFYERATKVCGGMRNKMRSIVAELEALNKLFSELPARTSEEATWLIEAAGTKEVLSVSYENSALCVGFLFDKAPLTLTITTSGIFRIMGIQAPHALQRLVTDAGNLLLDHKDLKHLTKQLNKGLTRFILAMLGFLKEWKPPPPEGGWFSGPYAI